MTALEIFNIVESTGRIKPGKITITPEELKALHASIKAGLPKKKELSSDTWLKVKYKEGHNYALDEVEAWLDQFFGGTK